MSGIDISEWQTTIPAGPWDFIICRATHDSSGVDNRIGEHFPNAFKATTRRGMYHYANPAASSGAAQARLFASNAIAHGFRKDIDLWALDSEGAGMSPDAHTANAAWVREFFATARPILGSRALWYVGWPYYVEHFGTDLTLLREHAWWLPAYGPNDGQWHAPECPYLPVLHQYTSRGGPGGAGLDVDRILDQVGWQRLVSPPKPLPLPPPKVTPVIRATHPPVDVKVINGKPVVLTSDGGVFCPEGGFYGTPVAIFAKEHRTAAALAVKGDPQHPLSAAEVAAGDVYAVLTTTGARYAYGPKK